MSTPVIVSSDNYGEVILDIDGKQHIYHIDAAQVPLVRQGFRRKPWSTFRKYLKGKEVKQDGRQSD